MNKTDKKSVAALVGATVVGAFTAPIAHAESNPFALKELSSGYTQVAEVVPYKGQSTNTGTAPAPAPAKTQEATCGQGKCGAQMMKQQQQMKCGAGMSGMQQPAAAPAQTQKAMEGKCAGMKMDGNSATTPAPAAPQQ
ncbi:hypothetical protein RP726_18240 [Candidatus Methylospira mobilis]|nr:hypothetical protein [Candidatus Methylospira mobilis]WNV04322.1 hypothetical protein RP726_18240 [Candidatus Methylospira mobilis]